MKISLPIFFSFFCATIVLVANFAAFGNDFSCPFGKQGACLDYNDKVCSSFAKCVDNNAVCFDSNTCNYKGFICKSQFDDLMDDYSGLASKCKSISDEYETLVIKYNNLIRAYESLDNCLSSANSVQDAKACSR